VIYIVIIIIMYSFQTQLIVIQNTSIKSKEIEQW